MRFFSWLCCAVVLSIGSTASYAQDGCELPTTVGSLQSLKTTFLAAKSIYGYYAIDNSCSVLYRQRLGKTVPFSILPAQNAGNGPAFVLVRSYRKFSTTPPDKIKLSRGDGWFYPDAAGKPAVQERIDDYPFAGSVDEWNSRHATPGTPEQLKDRLKFLWHAYADDKSLWPSTHNLSAWSTRANFDFSQGTVTNYLLRFPADSKTPIPFYVGIQSQVLEFELMIDSNVEGLSGNYRFVLK